MEKLNLLDDDTKIASGSIIRLYGVGRMDRSQANYKQASTSEDFYDYMLVDCNVLQQGLFMLINITSDNINKGSILKIFEHVETKGWIVARFLKEYFSLDSYVVINQ